MVFWVINKTSCQILPSSSVFCLPKQFSPGGIYSHKVLASLGAAQFALEVNRPQGYKAFFMLNSTEHEIFPAHKC